MESRFSLCGCDIAGLKVYTVISAVSRVKPTVIISALRIVIALVAVACPLFVPTLSFLLVLLHTGFLRGITYSGTHSSSRNSAYQHSQVSSPRTAIESTYGRAENCTHMSAYIHSLTGCRAAS